MRSRVLSVVALLAVVAGFQTLHAADVAGKWQFVLQTDGGQREVMADFKVDGEKVTGTWGSTEVQGTFKDGKLELSFPFVSTEGGISATIVIKGQLEGDAITGSWTFGDYAGQFKANRPV
jgi:hypothetical protein